MKLFFEKFRTFYMESAFYTAVGGRIYTDGASDKTPYPYAIISFPSGIPKRDLEGKKDTSFTTQLDIYSRNESEFLTLFDSADTVFDGCSFAIAGYQLVSFKMASFRRIKEDGTKRWIIDFSIKIGEV